MVLRANETLQLDIGLNGESHHLIRYKNALLAGFYQIHSKPEAVRPKLVDTEFQVAETFYSVNLVWFSDTGGKNGILTSFAVSELHILMPLHNRAQTLLKLLQLEMAVWWLFGGTIL